MANRPTAPHLQIWRWGPHMTVSILHRASGTILALVGLPLLLWWLGALAGGPEAYSTLTEWIWSGAEGDTVQGVANLIGKAALVVTTWALFEHTLSGLRHYVLDMGAGYELTTNKFWSHVVLIGAPVLTALFWAVLLLR
ncbi:succinate dehydrogenase, cytochrome b556 subunit [Tsuneonella sp. HG249]